MSFSAAVVASLESSEQCSTHHRFCLINVLHRFVRAERGPDDDDVCKSHMISDTHLLTFDWSLEILHLI